MFSGIVEETAKVVGLVRDQENLHITMTCSFTGELKIDQSVSHNGVCLTVVSIDNQNYTVTAIRETLEKSNLGLLQTGDEVNLERSMRMDGRLDGHIVQGHVTRPPPAPAWKRPMGAGIIPLNLSRLKTSPAIWWWKKDPFA
jgi:riboflavin synthase